FLAVTAAMFRLSGEKASPQIGPSWPTSWRTSLPAATSHRRMIRSIPPMARSLPSGARAMHMAPRPFGRMPTGGNSLLAALSQTRIRSSLRSVPISRPASGVKTSASTALGSPSNVRSFFPLAASARTGVPSQIAAKLLPSGANAAAAQYCPSKVARCRPVCRSQRRGPPSAARGGGAPTALPSRRAPSAGCRAADPSGPGDRLARDHIPEPDGAVAGFCQELAVGRLGQQIITPTQGRVQEPGGLAGGNVPDDALLPRSGIRDDPLTVAGEDEL